MVTLLNFNHLRVFYAVYEEGNIRDAAERLHRTPSAVSLTLKQFEDHVGASLFVSDRKNHLSEVGMLIAREVRTLLEHTERTERNISSFAKGLRGQLDVACVPSISVAFLSQTLSSFWENHPGVRVNVRDMDSRSAQEAVESGAVDLGIGALFSRLEPLAFTPMFEDRLSLVCPADDPLCEISKPVEWEQLAGRRFFANSSYRHIRTPAFLKLEASKQAVVPNIISLLSLVGHNAGVTVLPHLSALQGSKRVRFLPLADKQATRVVGVLARRGHILSPAEKGFIEILTSVVIKHAEKYSISLRC